MKRKDLVAIYKFLEKFRAMSYQQQTQVLKKFEKYIAKNGG